MPSARSAVAVCAALLALLAIAPAAFAAAPARIAVLSPDGRMRSQPLPRAAAAALPQPPGEPTRRATAASRGAALRALARLRDAGRLDPTSYAERRAAYRDAAATARRLTGTRARELRAVVDIVDGIAARGRLTPSRLAPLWETLARNREWWSTAPLLPAPGERVGFEGSELVWQYYAGSGLQIQWLGTFGKLNWLARSTSVRRAGQAGRLVDEILPMASVRAGGRAWEYLFPFGGGAPPWTSGLSQGTGLQALARAAVRSGREDEVFAVTRRALSVFQRRTPQGVRVAVPGGVHYAQYSFAPGLRILNGFVQSVVGLHDYAEITGDPTARELFEAGERQARREVPRYDTGAWSLYSRGTSTHESSLEYHVLLRDFLRSLCQRVPLAVYCATAERFTEDLARPPVVRVPAQALVARSAARLRLRLDKVSSLDVRVTRGSRLLLARSLGFVGRGTVRVWWAVPRRTGDYVVTVTARDLAGNVGGGAGTVRVVRRRG